MVIRRIVNDSDDTTDDDDGDSDNVGVIHHTPYYGTTVLYILDQDLDRCAMQRPLIWLNAMTNVIYHTMHLHLPDRIASAIVTIAHIYST